MGEGLTAFRGNNAGAVGALASARAPAAAPRTRISSDGGADSPEIAPAEVGGRLWEGAGATLGGVCVGPAITVAKASPSGVISKL